MKIEVSAGGVVFRKVKGKIEFLIVQHSGHHRWVLPKGWIDPGETKEQTALREVKEEAGVDAEVGEYLGSRVSFYTNTEDEKVRKTSHYFLMKYVSGDPAKDRGWETEDYAWLSPQKTIEKLDYPGEKEIAEKASKILSSQKIKGSASH